MALGGQVQGSFDSQCFMRIVLLAFALALSRSAARAQPSPVAPSCDADESRRRICAVDDSLRDALIRADTTTLARLYADELLTTNYLSLIHI